MKLYLAIAITLSTTVFQAPANPPMKMGLWEEVGGTMPSKGPGGKASSRVVRSCFTPANWLKLMGPTAKDACPKSNEVWRANAYSFDVQCAGKPKVASVSVVFDNPQTNHLTLDLFSPSGAVSMHDASQGHWVSSECGDVSPDTPVVITGAKPTGSQ